MSTTTKSLFIGLLLSLFSFNASAVECSATLVDIGFCNVFGDCMDPQADSDSDTVSNAHEMAAGTNLLCVDSDEDDTLDVNELGDFPTSEINTETIANIPDTDGDGTIDALDNNTCFSADLFSGLACIVDGIVAGIPTQTVTEGTGEPEEETGDTASSSDSESSPSVFSNSGGSAPAYLLIALLGLLTLRKKF